MSVGWGSGAGAGESQQAAGGGDCDLRTAVANLYPALIEAGLTGEKWFS